MQNFEKHCHKINLMINIGADRSPKTMADEVLCYMTDTMKKLDPAFNSMYRGFKISGSYADDLKISHPNEFDFVLTIKLPLLKQCQVRCRHRRLHFLYFVSPHRSRSADENHPGLCENWCRSPAQHSQPAKPRTYNESSANLHRSERLSAEDPVRLVDPLAAGQGVWRSTEAAGSRQVLAAEERQSLWGKVTTRQGCICCC